MLTFSNHKLDKSFGIFNMSTASECSSYRKGMCRLPSGVRCYAYKAECLYKDPVLNHRRSQAYNWYIHDKFELLDIFINKIKKRKLETKYIRYNEAGDFNTQEDIIKLNYISKNLKKEYGIIVYGYTARRDLDYSDISFLCKGSGFYNEFLNGMTIVINKNDPIPNGYFVCKGKCGKDCNLCLIDVKHNICFIKH